MDSSILDCGRCRTSLRTPTGPTAGNPQQQSARRHPRACADHRPEADARRDRDQRKPDHSTHIAVPYMPTTSSAPTQPPAAPPAAEASRRPRHYALTTAITVEPGRQKRVARAEHSRRLHDPGGDTGGGRLALQPAGRRGARNTAETLLPVASRDSVVRQIEGEETPRNVNLPRLGGSAMVARLATPFREKPQGLCGPARTGLGRGVAKLRA